MKKLLFTLLWCFPIITVWAVEYTVQTVPNNQLSDARAFVTNPDGIISTEAEWELNRTIAVIRDSTSAEIAVVLLHSIGNKDIDNFATDLFTLWGIGKKENDNGLLFLLVYDQRQMVFRTGYGLEGVLPDAYLSRIIRNDIAPHLSEGNFDAGVIAGMEKVCTYLLDPEAAMEIQTQEADDSLKPVLYGYLTISLIIFTIAIVLLFSILKNNKTNYKRYLAMNRGTCLVIGLSVFFPVLILFCIIFFIVKRRMRTQPTPCSECKQKMRLLNKPEENTYLTEAQQTEKTIKSVDYDVWLCDTCGQHATLRYDQLSNYKQCPHCKAKAYHVKKENTLVAATVYASGVGERISCCRHCNITDKNKYTIPRIVITSGGGHGISGSSRSSGGSWGGGHTGGGGARGGW